MIKANNPELRSWVPIPEESDFPIQNLPYGRFRKDDGQIRIGIAIGTHILDLFEITAAGLLEGLIDNKEIFEGKYLNDYIALGKTTTNAVRDRLSVLLSTESDELRENFDLRERALLKQDEVKMLMPVKVGDYTDFYSSLDHATNVGTMFRDPNNALLPNWKHLPVGYHGRASSIVVSGTSIHRPKGQMKPKDDEPPVFGPTKLLDFELEVAFITGKATLLGQTVPIKKAEDHIFGLVLFNDLSARDIQKWEYVPLGPFLAKNFGSAVSPWIVTLEALEPFRTEGYKQEPEVLPYLKYQGNKNYDIKLEVDIRPKNGKPHTITRSNFRYMYWNMCQQLAHQTINGCNINVGDMYASGTISGPEPSSYGSMLELSWRGTKPVSLPDGSERKFIQDGDTVIMRGYGKRNGVRIGFGKVETKILPALEMPV